MSDNALPTPALRAKWSEAANMVLDAGMAEGGTPIGLARMVLRLNAQIDHMESSMPEQPAPPTPAKRAEWRRLAEHVVNHGVGVRYCETEYLPLLAEAVLAMAGQLDDYEESTRLVMQERCGDDRLHCTCVPALREQNAALRKALEAVSTDVETHAQSEGETP